jgi:hypothetical protein
MVRAIVAMIAIFARRHKGAPTRPIFSLVAERRMTKKPVVGSLSASYRKSATTLDQCTLAT